MGPEQITIQSVPPWILLNSQVDPGTLPSLFTLRESGLRDGCCGRMATLWALLLEVPSASEGAYSLITV